MIENSRDYIHCKLLRNIQSDLLSVVFNSIEQVMPDFIRNKVIGDTFDADIANFFDTDAVGDRLSKRLFISTTLGAYCDICETQN